MCFIGPLLAVDVLFLGPFVAVVVFLGLIVAVVFTNFLQKLKCGFLVLL